MGPRPNVPPAGAQFLAEQPWVVLGGRRSDRTVWCTLLSGPAGFMRVDGPALTIRARPVPGDPLAETLGHDAKVGLLGIELASRRRMRVNGRSHPAVVDGVDGLRIDVDEALGNCPRYIHRRAWTAVEPTDEPSVTGRGEQLSASQADWIRSADTFFIATTDEARNADASHRGGPPGFVSVVAPDRLEFPDYPGNNMFLTLGNISVEPTAGLLFIDWTSGAVLHLSGSVAGRREPAGRDDGTERTIEFTIEHVVERRHVVPLRWSVVAAGD
jgi:hypothetical protein